jgi:hypothetical protein
VFNEAAKPNLYDLDIVLDGLQAAVKTFEEGKFISLTVTLEGAGVKWDLKPSVVSEASVDDASALTMTTAVVLNVCSISIPAKTKMRVNGLCTFKSGAGTATVGVVSAGGNVTTTSLGLIGQYDNRHLNTALVVRATAILPERIVENVTGAPITFYLAAQAVFSAGDLLVSGWLRGVAIP